MKKSNILIAVFVGLVMVSVSKAEEMTVNFDGAADMGVKFSALAGEAIVPEAGIPVGVAVLSEGRYNSSSYATENGCALYCPYGSNGDCSCKNPWQDIWEQAGGDSGYECVAVPTYSWAGEAKCSQRTSSGELPRAKAKGQSHVADHGVHAKLVSMLLGYCNTYPEFSASVLPNYRNEDAKIALKAGFVYIISGDRILRLQEHQSGVVANEEFPQRLTWQDGVTIVNAGAAVINTVFQAADNVVPAAVENYYSHQYNNPHENQNGGSGATYHSGYGGNSNYDVNKRIN